jgi:hypothetical protein
MTEAAKARFASASRWLAVLLTVVNVASAEAKQRSD